MNATMGYRRQFALDVEQDEKILLILGLVYVFEIAVSCGKLKTEMFNVMV